MPFRRSSNTFFLILFLVALFSLFNSMNANDFSASKVAQGFLNLIIAQKQDEASKPTKLTSLVASSAAIFTSTITVTPEPTPLPTVTPTPMPAPLPVSIDSFADDPNLKDAAWGQAVQVSETGYRMKVGFDPIMAEPKETFQALNLYRYTKGKSNLTWDDRLAKYALERATFICQNGSDGHAGFQDYVENQEGYKTLGFYSFGENMSVHMKMTGTHLIEWMYAADPAHDGNQLDNWSHVGVGIYEDCSDLIFGNSMI